MPLDDETKRIIDEEWSLPPELPTESAAAPSGNAEALFNARLLGQRMIFQLLPEREF